jgi:hypothetical protein
VQVFLLSPAYCGGRRATLLLRPQSTLVLTQRLHAGTLTLGEAFTFMSGLYFRGKMAYASKFGTRVLVITPTRGLQSPEVIVTADLLREFATVDVKSDDPRYRRPLDRSLKGLARSLPVDVRVILLGSIATGKYLDALNTSFGDRLCYPSEFVGRGDMSRGGLMLRCVTDNTELSYVPLAANAPRHGARPPKLPPLPRSSSSSASGHAAQTAVPVRWSVRDPGSATSK